MSLHSYSKCWIHVVWGTLNREKLLPEKKIRKKISDYLYEYSRSKKIFMKKNYVNSDHVHALIDMPTSISIEDMMHLLKGSSSHWINQHDLLNTKFSWGRGYGAFTVSESVLNKVVQYIENQEEHHKKKTFTEEYQSFIQAYGLLYTHDN
jgi:putative transposase